MDRVYRDLYRQLTEDERLQLDTLVLQVVAQEADGRAFIERNPERAVRAARRVVNELRDESDLREERMRALLDFNVPDTANAAPTIENLRAALGSIKTEIDDRVRDGLQVDDLDPVEIARLSRTPSPTPTVMAGTPAVDGPAVIK